MRARGSSAPPTSHDKLSVKTLIETSFDREVKTKSDEPKAKVAEYPPKVENQPASCHGSGPQGGLVSLGGSTLVSSNEQTAHCKPDTVREITYQLAYIACIRTD